MSETLEGRKGHFDCMSWGMMGGHLGAWGIIEEGWRKGPWTAEEDRLLTEYVKLHGEGRWNSVARLAGLRRNGKSCRLRWVNYLRPDLKRGQITPHEENIILELHARWGNRWSTIARSLPGRTDNEIKNYWRTHFKKKGKLPSDKSEKAKTRLLRKQQFYHQQQQQQQQLQQQQQQQLNQLDLKRIMALLDQPDIGAGPTAQTRQENIGGYIYNNHLHDEHGYAHYHTIPIPEVSTQESSSEDIIWEGLWNLDDFHGNLTSAAAAAACATSKAASLHHLVAPFY